MSAALKRGPSLQHFIIQAELIASYRKAVRATRPIPDERTRRETLDWLRSDLERLRSTSDLTVLETHLSSFNRSLKQLVPSLGLSGLGAAGASGAKLVGRGGKRTWRM